MRNNNQITLSVEDGKIVETPVQLYEFLREKFLVTDLKIGRTNKKGGIYRMMEVDIPGFIKTNPKHRFSIHLEKTRSKGELSADCSSLILGENWPESGNMWSRIFEVEASISEGIPAGSASYAHTRYTAIKNNLFEKEYLRSIEVVAIFMNVLIEFLKQY